MAEAGASPLGPAAMEPVAGSIRSSTDVHESENSGYRDGAYSELWLSRELGVAEASLPPHWR